MAVLCCSIVFFYMLLSSQLVHGSADATIESNKCHCSTPVAPSVPDIGSPIGGSYSPPPDGGITPPSTPESPPSYSPPVDGGISPPSTPESPQPSYSPPVDGGNSPPSTPESPPTSYSPPVDGGSSPPSSAPPSPCISATPPLTPPYSHKGNPSTPPSVPSPSSPPCDPTPSVPPSPLGGGGSLTPTTPDSPTPTTPSYGTPSSPTTPSTPDNTPPAYTGGAPLPSPSTPEYGVPTVASPPLDYSVPSSPDSAGSVPSVPDLSPPDGSTPVVGDPGSTPGTCSFWGSHPDYLPSILSFFSSISDLFGSGFSPAVFSGDMTLQEALTNTRRDGYGSLLREGSASFLNSLVNNKFVFSTQEVKQKFNAALVSNHAAAVQATKFKTANEGRLLP